MPVPFRRRVLIPLLAPVLAAPPTLAATPSRRAASAGGEAAILDSLEWLAFCGRFLRPDGRVVDTSNGGISHSEGQGYAMLAAVRADDQGSFVRMLAWTLGNLKRREDNLCSWRYQPDQ